MFGEDTLKIHTSLYDLETLGRYFGAFYLAPLLDSPLPELRSLVVATYGAPGSGKSYFLSGAAVDTGLPVHQDSSRLSSVEHQGRLFRHYDFGSADIVPRRRLARSGVDYYEHAPFFLVDSPGAVVTIFDAGGQIYDRDALKEMTGDVDSEWHRLNRAVARMRPWAFHENGPAPETPQETARRVALRHFAAAADEARLLVSGKRSRRTVAITPAAYPAARKAFDAFTGRIAAVGFKLAR